MKFATVVPSFHCYSFHVLLPRRTTSYSRMDLHKKIYIYIIAIKHKLRNTMNIKTVAVYSVVLIQMNEDIFQNQHYNITDSNTVFHGLILYNYFWQCTFLHFSINIKIWRQSSMHSKPQNWLNGTAGFVF